MKFDEALKLMKEGKKVRRKGWNNREKKWLVESSVGYVVWSHNDVMPHISIKGYLADDWEEYKEKDGWNFKRAIESEWEEQGIINKLKQKILKDERELKTKFLAGSITRAMLFNELEEIKTKRFGF